MASATPGIPGLDVTELDDLGNPKNPSLRTGASPQAQAWQASRAVPPAATVAEEAATLRAAAPKGGFFTRAAQGIGDAAQAAKGFVTGPSTTTVGEVAGKATSAAKGVGGAAVRAITSPLALAAGGIYGAKKSFDDVGDGYRDHFIQQTGAESPLGTAAADGLRTMSNVGDALTFGVAGRVGRGISAVTGGGNFGDGFMSPSDHDQFLATKAPAALPPTAAGAPQTTAPAALPPTAAGAPQAPAPTNITRTGNSYTGPDNIAGPITINGMEPGSGLRGDPSPQNQAAAQALSDKYGGAPTLPTPMVANADGTGGMVGINGTPFAGGAEHAAQFRQQVSRSNLEGALRDGMRNPRTAAAAMNAAAGLQGEDNGLAIASMKEQGETLRSGATNNVAMQTAKLRAGVETRGQDMGLEGHKYTADQTLRGSIARTNYDIKKDQRDNEQKLENQQYERTAGATKRLQSEFESTLPQVEGKPDTARAALYANGLPAFVASHKQQLEKAVAANPGSATLRAQLDTLNTKGADAITTSPTGLAQFLAGMQLAELARGTATNGFTPGGTRAVASNEPITSIRSDGRGNYVTNRRGVNGETEVIPARYIETEGGVMGTSFGGKASNKFAALIEK